MAQLFTTQYGKTARPVNPYAEFINTEKGFGTKLEVSKNPKWVEFEQSVQHYPIHSPNPIKGEFWGEEIQVQKFAPKYTKEGDVKPQVDLTGCYFEKAIKPIEKPLEGEEYEIPESPLSLQDIEKGSWNSAIDECVKVAKGLPYEPFLLIDKLNSLRK